MASAADFGTMAMFPLQSALLPGEDLPLQIFEPRYAELVRDCLRDNDPRFGVVLISQGGEVGGGDVRCDVGTVAKITECVDIAGSGRFILSCRTAERIKVCEWLPDDPYPRAVVQVWIDEAGEPVSAAGIEALEDRITGLFERIANARDLPLPSRGEVLGDDIDRIFDPGERLYALASRIPIGPADRYAVLAAPSAAERLTALSEAVDSVAAVIEFQLSE
ncbi:MAG: LON peptidase substrate-binding domain-containing protein [Mycobacterium sp.]